MLLSWTYKYNPPTTKEVVDFNFGGSESKHKRQLRHRHTGRVKKKKPLKFQSKLEPPWPSNNFRTRRMEKKECEFTDSAEAVMAEFQVWNQKNGKETLQISTNARATLAQLVVGN
jgi:hypothetical protein